MKRVIALPDKCVAPPPQWEAFEAFTLRALRFLATLEPESQHAIEVQAKACPIDEINYSGSAFYVTFKQAAGAPEIEAVGPISARAHPAGDPDDFDNSVYVSLILTDGWLDSLEVDGFDGFDRKLPADISGYELTE